MADDKTKGIDNLSKPSTGSNLTKYWKDFFPERGIKVFVYKGINQRLRGRNIFSKEDDISLIALEQVAEFEGIFGGEAYSNQPLTVTEDKSIKELELNNIPQRSVTAFLKDLKFNYKDHNLYFTIDEPFIERDVDEEYLDVYTADTVPGTFARILNSLQRSDLKSTKDEKAVTIGFNLTPAVLKNSLQSSKVSFVSDAYIKDVSNKKDFEIESIDIEADHTTMFEFKNWIKTKGDLQFSTGQIEEVDIDLVADKPFLPLQIQPFAKNGNVQFLIANFNKYNNIPYLYAKYIYSDKEITVSSYITQLDDPDTAADWIKELNNSVNGMFILSWAFSTGFEEYRDATGAIPQNTKIAGLSIEYLQSKGVTPLEAIDSVLEKFKYKHPDKIETPEFIRARQLLSASSQWINSSYCIAKGNTEVHKMILDFYFDLNTLIDKTSTDIHLKIGSLKYDFKTDLNLPDPIIPILKHGNSESNPWIEIIGRYISIPEMEDPISISDVRTFPGDFNSEGYDLLKTFVGVDVTESDSIKGLLINTQTSVKTTKTLTSVFNTGWIYIPKDDIHRGVEGIPSWENSFDIQSVLFSAQGYKAKTVSTNQFFKEIPNIYVDLFKPSEFLQPYYLVDSSETDLLSKYPQTKTEDQFKLLSISIPEGATNVQITKQGTKKEYLYLGVHTFARWEGIEYTYDISVEENAVDNERVFYDKGTFEKFILNYVTEPTIKRKLTLSDKHKVLDNNGNVLYKPKWKSIQRIFLSFFLGNHVDIQINYSYTDDTGNKATGFVKVPRITLPSKHDELRTKLGIRLGLGSYK